MSEASAVKAKLIAKQVIYEVSDTTKKVKIVGFIEAVRVVGFIKAVEVIKVIKTVTGEVVYIRPFCYI